MPLNLLFPLLSGCSPKYLLFFFLDYRRNLISHLSATLTIRLLTGTLSQFLCGLLYKGTYKGRSRV